MMIVANTIAAQLGSALPMMGATNLVGSANSLRFKVGRGAQHGINYLQITLRSDDTYTVTAQKYSPRNLTVTKVMESEGVYADNLKAVIGRMTGFAMSL